MQFKIFVPLTTLLTFALCAYAHPAEKPDLPTITGGPVETIPLPPTKPPTPTPTTCGPVACSLTVCGGCPKGSHPVEIPRPCNCPLCTCVPDETKTPEPTPTVTCSQPIMCPLTICGRSCPPGSTPSPTPVDCRCPLCGCAPVVTSTKPTPTFTTPPVITQPPQCYENPCIAALCPVGSLPTITSRPGDACPSCSCSMTATVTKPPYVTPL
ncbi:hypothetical protein FA13DRAFT_207347 [Coprinellus micaceus]|uniref:Uncharacterized protein n=1 Tax=Coprinellus micaceus TaxID=71717 RepID=A0A4Y7SFX7_COPMI|nr:hypothetical protein FA13DRAFT_207347 [Coprinellus micaceus]